MANAKEIKELLAALAVVGVAVKRIAADKKVGPEDLAHLIALGQEHQVLLAGVQGLGDIDVKAISLADVIDILQGVKEAVDKVKAA